MTDRAPSSAGSAVRAVARKELLELARDGRFRAAAAVALGLLLVAVGFGLVQARALREERLAADHGAEEHWKTQDDKNPHVAAHYGTYVFKPAGPLPFLDPGVEPYLGGSIKLEAHRRNGATGARALDATGLSRFGGLSAALVLQLLVPLLVIGLAFGAWTSERERGTLRQLQSLGVSPWRILAGKALGLTVALVVVLAPAAVAVGAAAAAFADGGPAGSTARLVAMGAAYAAYVAIFVALTLAVSSRARSSRGALVAMLGFWVVTAQVAPRAASDAAAFLAPAPTQAEVAAAVREGIEVGVPGGPAREARVEALTEAILEREGFAGAETLMDASLLASLELEAEATFENEVIDHHHARLSAAITRQERVAEAFAVVSPVIAVRTLSRALAGTDVAHHQHFEAAAEAHRRALVDALHRAFARKGGDAGWDYRAGREVWDAMPDFEHQPPGVAWVLSRHTLSVAALGAWLVGAALLAARGASRIQVVG